VAVVLMSVAVTSLIRGREPGEATVVNPSGTTSAGHATVFRCGDRLDLAEATHSRSGLSMAIIAVRHSADSVGPDITVEFTATTAMRVV
jgi:hypothetical protein